MFRDCPEISNSSLPLHKYPNFDKKNCAMWTQFNTVYLKRMENNFSLCDCSNYWFFLLSIFDVIHQSISIKDIRIIQYNTIRSHTYFYTNRNWKSWFLDAYTISFELCRTHTIIIHRKDLVKIKLKLRRL